MCGCKSRRGHEAVECPTGEEIERDNTDVLPVAVFKQTCKYRMRTWRERERVREREGKEGHLAV